MAPKQAVRRSGKPYIYATWLAKLLGGNQCLWSVWFKAHYQYQKYEEMAGDLVKWNRDHNKLMVERRKQLEADGWTVYVEDENSFKLEGASAVVAGKPDLVAVKGDRVLLVDGKTGRQRESDVWQVLLYLYALPKIRPTWSLTNLEGEVHYRDGDINLTALELTPERMKQLVDLIKVVSSDVAPKRTPSRFECRACNIGKWDCPQRVMKEETTLVGEF